MSRVRIAANGQVLSIIDQPDRFVTGSQEFVEFQFIRDSSWDGCTFTFAQFSQNGKGYRAYLNEQGCAFLPAEIVAGPYTVSLFGSGERSIGTTHCVEFTMDEKCPLLDPTTVEISKTMYQQVMEEVELWRQQSEDAVRRAEEAADRAENAGGSGGGSGKPGSDGATFIPQITSVAGGHQLSWSNDQSKPNPDPVIIRDGKDGAPGQDGRDGERGPEGSAGKDGKDGKTPVKGVDYFTVQEIEDVAKTAAKQVKIIVDIEMSAVSSNAVQNKVIKKYVDDMVGVIDGLVGGGI